MRFSLLHLLLLVTAVSVLLALVVHVPLARAIIAALVFGLGPGTLLARGVTNPYARWLRATLGAWIGCLLWTYLIASFPGSPSLRDVAWILGASLTMACFLGLCISGALEHELRQATGASSSGEGGEGD